MLNGLDIYRNSQPEIGYPIALMHLAGTSDDRYTPETLARAKLAAAAGVDSAGFLPPVLYPSPYSSSLR